MSDLSPLKLVDDGQSSSGSQPIEESSDRHNRQVVMPDKNANPVANNRTVTTTNQERPRSPSQISTQSSQLKYGAKSVIDLFVPVSICMCIVVATIKATHQYNYTGSNSIFYGQLMYTDQSVSTETRIWQSIVNAVIMLVMIVVMTSLLIFLYIYRFYRTIRGWLIMSSLMLLFMFTATYIAVFLQVYNVAMDWITLSVVIWNIGVFGMICIHWKGPLLAQQSYLIMVSALMTLVFLKCLPDWTVWSVLAAVSIWDLFAVLPSQGPLRVLVETAQERNEPIFPALIYSSTILWEFALTASNSIIPMADSKPSGSDTTAITESADTSEIVNPKVEIIQPRRSSNDSRAHDETTTTKQVRTARHRNQTSRRSSLPEEDSNSRRLDHTNVDMQMEAQHNNQLQDEERGVKLGLGDFIFYSLLVGKVSSYDDWTITISCYVAVLVGLSMTLSLLAVARKALPALPISIAFGLAFYFLSSLFMVDLASELSFNQIFI